MIARVACPGRLAAALLLALAATPAFAAGPQVLFLRGGEVWRAEGSGRGGSAVTNTGGTVEAFEPSRDGRYLAYEQVVGFVDDPGDYEEGEEIPQAAVTRIVLTDLASRRVLATIPPTTDTFVHIGRWLAGGTLVFYSASGLEVSGFFAYDVARGTTRELDGEGGYAVANASDQSADGLVRVVIDMDSRVRLLDLERGGTRDARRSARALALCWTARFASSSRGEHRLRERRGEGPQRGRGQGGRHGPGRSVPAGNRT